MNNRTILNKVKELLGMEVKLEQRKLEDGVTVIEADEFAPDNEVMIVTEDEQCLGHIYVYAVKVFVLE